MKIRVLLTLLAIAGLAAAAGADVPRSISYQGILRNTDGSLVPNGDYQLTFRIYDTASGETTLWSEVQTVPITNGVCSVILGSVTSLNLPFDRQYWLGVAVGESPELAPRLKLTSVPYARRAAIADSLSGAAGGNGWIVVGDDMYAGVSGSVGIGTATPDTSAILELAGTRGFLPPRMTQVERNAIPQPKDGLMIFNTDTGCINYYAGGIWLVLCGNCLPDCAGKACGSDGCGGSCGTCPTGTHCDNFQCVCDVDECTPAQSYCAGLQHHGCEEQPAGCGDWVISDCNDGNPCTIDACDPQLGCSHTPVANGTSCGSGMICVNGTCLSCTNNGGTSCGAALYMGYVCGDQGTYVLNQYGCSGGWFGVLMQECEGGMTLNDLDMRIDLQSPVGNDYDLYVYSPSCGNLVGQSTLGAGQLDRVTVHVDDQMFSSQDTYYYIEVRVHTLTTSAQWYLETRGNP